MEVGNMISTAGLRTVQDYHQNIGIFSTVEDVIFYVGDTMTTLKDVRWILLLVAVVGVRLEFTKSYLEIRCCILKAKQLRD